MNVAVVTMTRDRLDYTKHCFGSLEQNAGCDFDHYIIDQASTDGTVGWLGDEYRPHWMNGLTENIGICPAINRIIDELDLEEYDVVVRYDNDCEVTQPDTLSVCADLAATYGAIVAPRVLGLKYPPATIRTVSLGGHLLDETPILGGIFMAIPAFAFTDYGFRYDERHKPGEGDEAIVPWWRAQGYVCGYLQGVTVNHYETTEGQEQRYPAYFDRKREEAYAA